MSNQVVNVRRDRIGACMTCPLCHKLFRDATTISECLHTFCRKCIYKKLSDEETECCPICNIDLGCVPLEKLRPDHNLQDVRAKVFPYKRRKVDAPEIMPSVALPVRRKERSLSSLVVSTPRVSTQTGMTGRRSKSVARKTLRGSTFSIEKPVKKEEGSGEDQLDSSSSPETLNKFTQNIRLNSSSGEPSDHPTPDKEIANGSKQWEGKVDLWKPLNCLVEAANRSKSSRFSSQGSTAKSEGVQSHDREGHVRKTKVKEHGHKLKIKDDNNDDPGPQEFDKPKKSRRIRQKKASAFGEFNISPQTVLDATSARCERRIYPIWFSLVASEDQEGDTPLPQISGSYLRIKDGNIPVSFIQKYLVRKLDLKSEDEVEIRCMGQSIAPSLPLNSLVDMWLQTTTSERIPAIIGSSAKDFVMVLAYARKIPVVPAS
ncbi:E3 ubiquitin protein ligase DRIP2-like isoform X1 [Nicotiana tabacum]|uniref:E3 ubiquitin protein ligase DRIP2-like n=2 Tax=Nicotiana TaxID=4085 RepID=A0A1S4C1I6_TOBAC|nr:PREDICTED: E3 ubiquitin protein ligase DRIP2-like isoform X1 [Nicotiana sylvestris]XP_016494903.1 PREDICTED: E3 ubiquitin protein ligase DRIP2-like [Nicotiana tabacum]XP_016494904.1 PREDICTED: E3 ubiquitin protein ligase DRIP2-like [Nicotiana tabacum]